MKRNASSRRGLYMVQKTNHTRRHAFWRDMANPNCAEGLWWKVDVLFILSKFCFLEKLREWFLDYSLKNILCCLLSPHVYIGSLLKKLFLAFFHYPKLLMSISIYIWWYHKSLNPWANIIWKLHSKQWNWSCTHLVLTDGPCCHPPRPQVVPIYQSPGWMGIILLNNLTVSKGCLLIFCLWVFPVVEYIITDKDFISYLIISKSLLLSFALTGKSGAVLNSGEGGNLVFFLMLMGGSFITYLLGMMI